MDIKCGYCGKVDAVPDFINSYECSKCRAIVVIDKKAIEEYIKNLDKTPEKLYNSRGKYNKKEVRTNGRKKER